MDGRSPRTSQGRQVWLPHGAATNSKELQAPERASDSACRGSTPEAPSHQHGTRFSSPRWAVALPDLAQSATLRNSRNLEDARGFCPSLLQAHVGNALRRNWSRRIYYHEADGPQHGYGIAAVCSSFARDNGKRGLADGGLEFSAVACGGHKLGHSDRSRREEGYTSVLDSMCPGGETGRRKGLKILFPATGVRVQVPPRAPNARESLICTSI